MMKLTVAILSLILISSCSAKPEIDNKYKVTDDEVILEFATKLEMNYHQFYGDRLHSVPANLHTPPEPGTDLSPADPSDHPKIDQ